MPAHYPGERLLDVVGATVALVVSMPLQMVIAVAIRCSLERRWFGDAAPLARA
jgi:lipopolysaccharide/colanic/teichoic acid biosynthesis glycosyltransferase